MSGFCLCFVFGRTISRPAGPTAYNLSDEWVKMCLGTIAPKTARRNEKQRLRNINHVQGIYAADESIGFGEKAFKKLFAFGWAQKGRVNTIIKTSKRATRGDLCAQSSKSLAKVFAFKEVSFRIEWGSNFTKKTSL